MDSKKLTEKKKKKEMNKLIPENIERMSNPRVNVTDDKKKDVSKKDEKKKKKKKKKKSDKSAFEIYMMEWEENSLSKEEKERNSRLMSSIIEKYEEVKNDPAFEGNTIFDLPFMNGKK